MYQNMAQELMRSRDQDIMTEVIPLDFRQDFLLVHAKTLKKFW
jgi:hypothetical protein